MIYTKRVKVFRNRLPVILRDVFFLTFIYKNDLRVPFFLANDSQTNLMIIFIIKLRYYYLITISAVAVY